MTGKRLAGRFKASDRLTTEEPSDVYSRRERRFRSIVRELQGLYPSDLQALGIRIGDINHLAREASRLPIPRGSMPDYWTPLRFAGLSWIVRTERFAHVLALDAHTAIFAAARVYAASGRPVRR
jgi:hypothetical protein